MNSTDPTAKWLGPYTKAETALDATRRAVAELIGADPEAWPDHGNAPLAIAAAMAVRLNALKGLVGLVQLVRSRSDCPVEIKQVLTDNYPSG